MQHCKIVITAKGKSHKTTWATLRRKLDEMERMSSDSLSLRRDFGEGINLKLSAWRNSEAGYDALGEYELPWTEYDEELFASDDETLIYHASDEEIAPGIPAFVSVTDGQEICGFSSEQITDCIRKHCGNKDELDAEIVAWLWEERVHDPIQRNFEEQAQAVTKHWAFRKFSEGTTFSTPDVDAALIYVIEELGEAARVYNLLQRPFDARNNPENVSVDDLHRELADLWLMLDTAMGNVPVTRHNTQSSQPSTLIEIASLVGLVLAMGSHRSLNLQDAKDAICRYPGFRLLGQVEQRLQAWRERIK